MTSVFVMMSDGPVRRLFRQFFPNLFGQQRTKTIFGPPRDPEMARQIRIDTPANARKSVKWLGKEWNKAKRRGDRDRMKHLKAAAVQAANRAQIGSKNKRISKKERDEYKKVEKIYRKWYKPKKLPKK